MLIAHPIGFLHAGLGSESQRLPSPQEAARLEEEAASSRRQRPVLLPRRSSRRPPQPPSRHPSKPSRRPPVRSRYKTRLLIMYTRTARQHLCLHTRKTIVKKSACSQGPARPASTSCELPEAMSRGAESPALSSLFAHFISACFVTGCSQQPCCSSLTACYDVKHSCQAVSAVRQGVDDAARATKRAVGETEVNAQSTSASARRQVDEGAASLQDGIDAGADAAKDILDGAPETRRQARQAVSQGADDLQVRLFS